MANHGLKKLIAAFLIWLIGGWPTIVFALPQDGQVVGGSGTITEPTDPNGPDMQINQNTSQMIINWQSFNIGSSEWVNFSQPNSSAIALNRVIGTDPSLLLGKLTGNGQVFISNGSGVFFGPSSTVDTHGFVATTMGIADQDFLDGNYNFAQDPNNLSSVINEGNISATSYVGLLAPAVENRGTIVTASLGSIDLASGKAATMDFTGDGLIQFEVTEAVSGTVLDKDGNELKDRVSNTGLLHADGGQIRMSAKDAGDVIRHVVNMEGMIKANAVVEKDGKVFLMGGDSGVVNVSGTIDASGDDAGEKGGTVQVTGEYVGLFDNARVDVSGDAGGGTALIGGDYQGKNPTVQNAKRTYVGEDAIIDASSGTSGDGGKAIVWADEITRFYGSVFATGGLTGGDGGFIEISGKQNLNFNGEVDASSIYGAAGMVLFDPKNITIANGGVDVVLTNDAFGENSTSSVTFDADLITAITNLGTNVTLQASNDITINEAIISNNGVGAGGDITLQAGRSVLINANITTDDGALTITANETSANGVVDAQRDAGAAVITMADGVTLNAGSGNIILVLDEGTGNTNTASANITIENLTTTGHASIRNDGDTAGSALLRASADSLITASSVNLDVDSSGGGGSIGTSANPIRVTVTNLDGHTHFTGAGIFIDSPTQGFTIGGSTLVGGTTGMKTATNSGTGDIELTAAGLITTTTTAGDNINAKGQLTIDATAGVTLQVNATSNGTTAINADSNNDGTGTLTIANSQTLNSTNNTITITAADLNMNISGAMTAGTGNITVIASNGGDIGLGDTTTSCGGACEMVISGSELGFITAANLTLGDTTTSVIRVDNISAANSNNVSGTITLNAKAAGGVVTFDTAASTFNTLEVNAENGIDMDIGLTTDTGAMTLVADSDTDGTGSVNFNSATTVVMTSATTITADRVNITGASTIADFTSTSTTTIDDLTLDSNGTLQADAAVSVTSVFTWAGASTINGSGSFTTTSGVTGSTTVGTGIRTLDGITWTQQGNFTWDQSGGQNFTFAGTNATLDNSGTFIIATTNASSDIITSGSGSTINNTGTFTHSGGVNTDIETGVAFNNNSGGQVNVTGAGGLDINSDGADVGAYAVSSGSTLVFGGGTRTFSSTTAFSGTGSLSFTDGTHTLTDSTYASTLNTTVDGASTIVNFDLSGGLTVADLTLDGGTLQGTGAITVTNTFVWSGASTIGGTGFTTTSGVTGSTTVGTGIRTLDGITWTQQGNFTWDQSGGQDFTFAGTNATLDNSGTFIIATTNVSSDIITSGTGSTINNTGTFTHSGGVNTDIETGVAFNNNSGGQVNVTGAGGLDINSDGADVGAYAVSSGSTLVFGGGTRTFSSTTAFSGTGSLSFTDGTHTLTDSTYASTLNTTVDGASTIVNFDLSGGLTVADLTFNRGTMQGSGDITVTNTFTWTAGGSTATIGGSGTFVTTSGVIGTMSGSLTYNLNRDWNNAGTITFANTGGQDFTIGSGSTLTNTGTFNLSVTNNSDIVGAGTFSNSGTVTTGGTGVQEIDTIFNNTGTVNVVTTDLNITNTGDDTGDYDVSASRTLTFSGGDRSFATTSGFTGAGDFTFSSTGTTTFTNVTMNTTGDLTFSGTTLTTGGTNLSITASAVTFSVALNAGTGGLTFVTSGNMTATAGALTANGTNSFTSTGGDITLNNASNSLGANLTIDTNNSFDVDVGGNALTDLTITVDPANTSTYTLSNVSNISAYTLTDSVADVTGSITATALNFSLNSDSGDIITSGNIDVGTGSFSSSTTNGSITINTGNTLDAGALTLDANGAAGDVNIRATATITGGAVSITADDAIVFLAAGIINATGAGNVSMQSNTDSTATGSNSGNAISMTTGSSVDAGSGTVTLTSTGSGAGNIALGSLSTTSSSNTAVSLTVDNGSSSGNISDANGGSTNISAVNGRLVVSAQTGVGSAGSLEVVAGSVDITNATSNSVGLELSSGLTIFNITSANQILITGSGAITQTGAITANGANGLSISTDAAVTLNNTSNDVNTVSILTTSGNISYVDADGFTVNTLNAVIGVNSSSGSVSLTAISGDITATQDITANSGITLLLSGDDATFDLNSGDTLFTTSGDIIVTADKMTLDGTVSAIGQRVTLKSSETGDSIDLGSTGSSATDTLELSDTELDNVFANYLEIGSSTQGAITLSSDVSPANVMVAHLISNSTITGTAGGIVVGDLAMEAEGTINFTDTTTDVDNLAIDASGFDVTFFDADDLDIDTVDSIVGVKAKSFTTTGPGPLTITSPIVLDSTGNAEQEEQVDQGTQSTFTQEFTSPADSGC